MCKKTCAGFASLLLVTLFSAQAQGQVNVLKLSVKTYSAIRKLNSSLKDIKNVEEVVRNIEQKKPPGVSSNKWANLAEKYNDAAAEIRTAELPTAFDKSQYAVTLDELRNCDTRQKSINRLKGYLAELKSAQERGQQGIKELDASLADANTSTDALTYLIKVHEKLITDPIYGKIFTWDWFELNTAVSRALGELKSALTAHRKQTADELAKINIYVSNLSANIGQLEGLSCSLAAHWKGNASGNGLNLPMSILVTFTNGQWAGQINLNDMGDTFRNVSVTGRSIQFTIGQAGDPFVFSGTMSIDGTGLSGTFTNKLVPGGGKFALSRQPN